jgi:hypothetical protein
MRRAHVMPAGVWPARVALSSRKLSHLDRNVAELVNADDGGLWVTTGPICIGGKGMTLDAASVINGGITTRPGFGANDPKIELVDQWPTFSATRTRTTCLTWLKSEGSGALPVYFNTAGSCVQSGISASNGLNIGMIIDSRQLHDQATLTSATWTFRYTGQKPSSMPTVEFASIIQYRRSDNVNDRTMHTAGTVMGVTYAGNAATRAIATVEELYAGGNVISLTYTPDQFNVIDKPNRYYGFGFNSFIQTEAIGLKLVYDVTNQRFE